MRQLYTLSEAEAQRTGGTEPDAERLFMAAVELPDGSAQRAFDRIGVDPAPLLGAIASQHDDALRAVGVEAPSEALLASGHPLDKRRWLHAERPTRV